MTNFSPALPLVGGAVIGLAASLLLLTHGKVAGVSGLFGGMIRGSTSDRSFQFSFVAGLVLAGTLVRLVAPSAFETALSAPLLVSLGAGVLVGIGTQLGSGCTSGHGVCGLSRLSMRSLVATATFTATAMATVFLARHLFGGGG